MNLRDRVENEVVKKVDFKDNNNEEFVPVVVKVVVEALGNDNDATVQEVVEVVEEVVAQLREETEEWNVVPLDLR